MSNLTKAISQWRRIVGQDNCLNDPANLLAIGATTFETGNEPVAHIKPANTEEVQACMVVAKEQGVPLYPVSRGRNWGLGSSVAASAGNAILDLARLDNITQYDEKMGTMRIQPGVTFQQAYDFLRNRESDYYVPAIGGPTDASILANGLERGDGSGRGGERFLNMYDYEVVLPCGDVVLTGFSAFCDSPVSQLHKTSVGPLMHGMFSQSNLGVVTEATISLAPLANQLRAPLIEVGPLKNLPRFIECMRPLLRAGIIGDYSLTVWNKQKLLARDKHYDNLSQEELGTENMDQWYGMPIFYAPSPVIMQDYVKALKSALNEEHQILTWVNDRMGGGERIPTPFTGLPSDMNLSSMYWRKKETPTEPLDPDRDRCGVIWVCPAIPFKGEDIQHAIKIMIQVVRQYKFEPNIGFQAISFRCFNAFLAIMYDRDVEGDDERAMTCHDEAMAALIEAGYPPYRLGVHSMGAIKATKNDNCSLGQRLKAALDPENILAPGRYDQFD